MSTWQSGRKTTRTILKIGVDFIDADRQISESSDGKQSKTFMMGSTGLCYAIYP